MSFQQPRGLSSTATEAFFDRYGSFLRLLRKLSSTATEAFFDRYGSFLRLLRKLSSTATGAFFDCYGSFLRLLHEHLLLLRELLGCLFLGCVFFLGCFVVCSWVRFYLVAICWNWFTFFGLRAGSYKLRRSFFIKN